MELELGPLRFGIIGAGRLGCTIGRALQRRGFEVVHASSATARGRDRAARLLQVPLHEDPVSASSLVDCVVLCVPDDAVEDVVDAVARRPSDASPLRLRIISTNSSGGLGALAPLVQLGHSAAILHPVATVSGDEPHPADLIGAGAAIGAGDEASRVFAHALAHALELHPFDLDDVAWPVHAAACTAAAALVPVVFGLAETLAVEAGIHPDVARSSYGRLAVRSIERSVREGADAVVGGAIIRGDVRALARQLDAVHTASPSSEHLMREALRVAIARATMSGRIDIVTSHALEQAIVGHGTQGSR